MTRFGRREQARAWTRIVLWLGLVALGGMIPTAALPATVSSAVAAPANDDFASPAQLDDPYVVELYGGSLAGASRQAGEPDHTGGGSPGKTVWYSWTPLRSGTYGLQVSGFGGPSESLHVAVYTGATLAGLTRVGQAAGAGPPTPLYDEGASVVLEGGVEYRIAVEAEGFLEADFALFLWQRDNSSPTALPDFIETEPGVTTVVPLLENDSDPDGDPLRVVVLTPGPDGLEVTPDGTAVVFTPTTTGNITLAYRAFDRRGGTSDSQFTISVYSGRAEVRPSGSSVSIGETQVGTPITRTAELANVGRAPLNVFGIDVFGSGADQIAVAPTGPMTIAPGDSVPLTLTCRATRVGEHSVGINISSSGAQVPSPGAFCTVLSGPPTPGQAQLGVYSSAGVRLDNRAVEDLGAIARNGRVQRSLLARNVAATPAAALTATASATGGCRVTPARRAGIAAGAEAPFSLECGPRVGGGSEQTTGSVTISGARSTVTVTYTWAIPSPLVVTSGGQEVPSGGTLELGQQSSLGRVTVRLRLRNRGDTPLTLGPAGFTTTTPFASCDLRLTTGPRALASAARLAARQSLTVDGVCSAQIGGTFRAELRIPAHGPDGVEVGWSASLAFSAAVSFGLTQEPGGAVPDGASIDLGTQRDGPGSDFSLRLRISNLGGVPLTIGPVSFTSGPALRCALVAVRRPVGEVPVLVAETTLAAGASVVVYTSCATEADGQFSGVLRIPARTLDGVDVGRSFTLRLAAQARFAVTVPAGSLSADSVLDLGTESPTAAARIPIELRNDGGVTLRVGPVAFSGGEAGLCRIETAPGRPDLTIGTTIRSGARLAASLACRGATTAGFHQAGLQIPVTTLDGMADRSWSVTVRWRRT